MYVYLYMNNIYLFIYFYLYLFIRIGMRMSGEVDIYFYLLLVYKLVFLVSSSDSRNRSFLYHLFFAGRMPVDDEKAPLLHGFYISCCL